ncbi:MAG: tetratricopeptide repeat protein [Candidatus Aminicenantes bacterium]|nr:tetratricopeptide repeat protein [Candidatus Aminicenantes bacterium]
MDKETIGKEHSGYAIDLSNLAGVLSAQGRYKEAEKLYRQALKISKETLGEKHPQTLTIQKNYNSLKTR